MIWKNIFGEDHADVARNYYNLAFLYNSLGDYNSAIELYERALSIWKKIFGEDHADVVTTTWHQCTTARGNTVRPKIFTKEHW